MVQVWILQRAHRRPNHRSTALKVIQERLELVGPVEDQAPYQIANRQENGQVIGVKVEVCLPVFN